MANTIYDIDIYQGVTFEALISATDSDSLPIDISGYDIQGCIREYYGATGSLLTFTISTGSPTASGVFTASLDDGDTIDLPVGQFVYDIKGTFSGTTQQFLQGYANVHPGACL